MIKIEDNILAEVQGGGRILNGVCAGIATGSVGYAAGVMTNFWNPVGWVSAAFLAADAACLAYAYSQLN